jgi:TfdA family taurine catabolism dioxygenase TauD
MAAHLSLRPLGKKIGTEIQGADLSQLDDETFAEIEDIFRDHPVLVFRDQKLDAHQLAAFGARFGHLRPHILENYLHPDDPRVSFITNVAKDGGVDKFVTCRRRSCRPCRAALRPHAGSPSAGAFPAGRKFRRHASLRRGSMVPTKRCRRR